MKKWSNPTYSEKVLTQSDIFTWKKIINPLKNVNNISRLCRISHLYQDIRKYPTHSKDLQGVPYGEKESNESKYPCSKNSNYRFVKKT